MEVTQAAYNRTEAIQELVGKAMLQSALLAGELRHQAEDDSDPYMGYADELTTVNHQLGDLHDHLIAIKRKLEAD